MPHQGQYGKLTADANDTGGKLIADAMTSVENWSLALMTPVVTFFLKFTLIACVIVIDTAHVAACVNKQKNDRQCQRPKQQIYLS